MPLDNKQLEALLHAPEGAALDFKSEQYPFQKAPDNEKAKLLKDILAMANSWRGTTAYILIGVQEVKGRPNELVGIQDHLDDADLHQFVNSKTQRAVEFSYQEIPMDGTTVGVIEIPLQQRPLYLKANYSNLRANVVFIRDGSSTRHATPDEVARMGAEVVSGRTPRLALDWADISERQVLQSSPSTRSVILEPKLPVEIIPHSGYSPWGIDLASNPNYTQEMISYVAQRALLTSIGMRLRNTGSVTGRRIRFVGNVLKAPTVVIRDEIDDPPSKSWALSLSGLRSGRSDDIDVGVREFADRWEIEIDFGDVRPGDSVWTDNELSVGSTEPCVIKLAGELRGDNLPEPIECELALLIEVDRRPMEPADILPYLDPR